MSKCIVLVGIKHSGKTTKGIQLAKQMNVPFFDIDAVIEDQTNKTCRELFSQDGFEAFQKAELEACKWVIEKQKEIIVTDSTKAIISTGGGICENKSALELLGAIGIIVYLDISFDTAFERIVENSQKRGSFPPTLGDSNTPTEEIKKNFENQYKDRTKKYLEFANLIVKTDGLSKQEVCDKIITELIT